MVAFPGYVSGQDFTQEPARFAVAISAWLRESCTSAPSFAAVLNANGTQKVVFNLVRTAIVDNTEVMAALTI